MQWYTHTLTGDSSIFNVGTVMNAKWVARTVHQSGLIPSAGHLVQKNGSSSLAKVGTGRGNRTCGDKFTSYSINYIISHLEIQTYTIPKPAHSPCTVTEKYIIVTSFLLRHERCSYR